MAVPEPLTPEEFLQLLTAGFGDALCGEKAVAVAVAVSGGPDSMALLRLLSLIFEQNPDGQALHALTVNHGLRPESADEAAQVHETVKNWPGVGHTTLQWAGEKPASGVQEAARKARYELMAEYCAAHNIRHLFLAHHQGDQAETFLFRLAKGSGLDGLAGMRARQACSKSLTLLRPLLDIPKERLVATCAQYDVQYVEDPTNESEKYARVRLRRSMDALEEEGLTPKRLSVTARRLSRARQALEETAADVFENSLVDRDSKRIVLNYKNLVKAPEEIAFRVILEAIGLLRPEEDYAPRMEKIENLFAGLMDGQPFRRRTLGGLVFERDDRKSHVIVQREDAVSLH